jgi:nitrogen fixation protein FixH
MFTKKICFFLGVLVIFAGLVFATGVAMAGQTSPSIKLDTQVGENTALESVVVGEDHSVTFRGWTNDLTGACLPVKVFIDGEREAWWPVYRCVNANETGEWMVRVTADEGRPMSIHFHIGK